MGEFGKREGALVISACAAVLCAHSVVGCGPSEAEKFRDLSRQINALKIEKIELEERLAKRDAAIEGLEGQLRRLREAGMAPPAPLFEVDRIEILGISGAIDTDGQTGVDAVAVYIRPLDRDGDVLKRGGVIDVRLIDFASSEGPRQVGGVRVEDADAIRRSWYGKFWTNHYKVVVPLAPGAGLRAGQELDIVAEFVDAATGRLHRARRVVTLNIVRAE